MKPLTERLAELYEQRAEIDRKIALLEEARGRYAAIAHKVRRINGASAYPLVRREAA